MGCVLLCPTIISKSEYFRNTTGFPHFARALQSLCTSGQAIDLSETTSPPNRMVSPPKLMKLCHAVVWLGQSVNKDMNNNSYSYYYCVKFAWSSGLHEYPLSSALLYVPCRFCKWSGSLPAILYPAFTILASPLSQFPWEQGSATEASQFYLAHRESLRSLLAPSPCQVEQLRFI